MRAVFKHNQSRSACQRGMGSVEALLFVIIGFVAFSWGFNRLGVQSREQMTDVRLQQVAKEMVKVSEAAHVAGVDLVSDNSVRQTIENLEKGETASYGIFAGQHYGVDKLDVSSKDKLEHMLYIQSGKLYAQGF